MRAGNRLLLAALGLAMPLAAPTRAGAGVRTVEERAAEYDASVQMTVVERYPDIPLAGSGRTKKGPPKVLSYRKDGKEIAGEVQSEDGLVESITGKIPDGPVRLFFTPMQKERELYYKNNLRNGPDRSFDRGGKVTAESAWVDGKPDGVRRRFEVDTGRLLGEEVWKDGVLVQVKTFWVESKEKVRTQQAFAGGKPGAMKYFDQDGKPTTRDKWDLLDDPELAKKSGPRVHPGRAENGETCVRDDQCVSGNCRQGARAVCAAKPGFRMDLGANQQCARDSWCLSGVCGKGSRCR